MPEQNGNGGSAHVDDDGDDSATAEASSGAKRLNFWSR